MFAYKHLVWHLAGLSVSYLLLNHSWDRGKKEEFKRQKAGRGGGGEGEGKGEGEGERGRGRERGWGEERGGGGMDGR